MLFSLLNCTWRPKIPTKLLKFKLLKWMSAKSHLVSHCALSARPETWRDIQRARAGNLSHLLSLPVSRQAKLSSLYVAPIWLQICGLLLCRSWVSHIMALCVRGETGECKMFQENIAKLYNIRMTALSESKNHPRWSSIFMISIDDTRTNLLIFANLLKVHLTY